MSSGDGGETGASGVVAPDYVVPGVRCALEMAIVGLIVLLVGLPTSSPLWFGITIVATLAAMTVVLFWCLNAHIDEWIRRAKGKPKITDGGETGGPGQ